MIPWELVDCAKAPEGGSELHLYRRGAEYSIRADGLELMNSRVSFSEEELARLVCGRINAAGSPSVLVGGLGMGFTLAAALACLSASAEVVVSERISEVVKWNRDLLGEFAKHPLRDSRVLVREVDVGQLIASEPNRYDAILLDVDNGPTSMPRAGNEGLYNRAGLERASRALRAGGVLGVWSANPDLQFPKRLRDAGFAVEEISPRARGYRKGMRHTIWIGRLRAGSEASP
jgi:spermidine synthase